MRHGILRSLSGLVAGTAFAVAVAGPAQWCACPTHGADAAAMVANMRAADAAMQMPEMEAAVPAASQNSATSHHSHGSHEAGHQCTCPGGCTSTTPVALHTATVRVAVFASFASAGRAQWPASAIELASNDQLALPFANAPPAFFAVQQDVAQLTS